MKKICILDYGSGNVRSVYNILSFLDFQVKISNNINVIRNASHLILPGVGSFGAAMKRINEIIPLDVVEQEVLVKGKPFLGICVGLQVLANKGLEHEENDGLGWISGSVNKLVAKKEPLPHIGWNDIMIRKPSRLFEGLEENQDFYFVHSYAITTDEQNVLSETVYEEAFCSSICRDNIYGVQFHPEKSQKAGQQVFNNFLSIR
jgi:imidazole glycerol-phosphate synthase subunit HisH